MIQDSLLPNGIRVVTDADPAAQSVTLGVWIAVGARYEKPSVAGISHVLEHMAFKGTTTRSAFQIAREIEDVGGIVNAYTGKEVTAYHVKVLRQDAPLALEILADIVKNSVMDPHELEKEKSVILQEIKMCADTPSDSVFDYFAQTAYPDQALGRPIIGTPASVKAMTSEKVTAYMRKEYIPQRLIISAAGAVAHEDFARQAQELFASLLVRKGKKAPPGRYVGGDKRVKKAHEQVNLVLGFQGCSYTDADYYSVNVLASVLGGGMSSRLFQEIREKRGLAYSIYAFNAPETDTGALSVYAGTGEHEVRELMPVLCDEIRRFPETLAEEEIERAKTRLKARLLMRWENIGTHAESNALDFIIRGRVHEPAEIIREIDAITPQALEACARRVFGSAPTFACLGPVGHAMDYPHICARLKNA